MLRCSERMGKTEQWLKSEQLVCLVSGHRMRRPAPAERETRTSRLDQLTCLVRS